MQKLESFIRESQGRAFQVAYSLTRDAEEAKELVQEALYRVARAWGSFESSKPVSSLFFTIMRNTFLDSRRRFDRRNVVSLSLPLDGEDEASLEDTIPDDADGIQESLERAEAVRTVRWGLNALKPEYRAALTLCDMDGLKYGDVARKLRVPIGTVRSHLSKARRTFRKNSPELADYVNYGGNLT